MPGSRGLGGAIIASANQGAAANQIGTATISSCMGLADNKNEKRRMASKGYVLLHVDRIWPGVRIWNSFG
jgi:hypothetical protein